MYKVLPEKVLMRYRAEGSPDPVKWRSLLSLMGINIAEKKRREIAKTAAASVKMTFTEDAYTQWANLIGEQILLAAGSNNRVLKADIEAEYAGKHTVCSHLPSLMILPLCDSITDGCVPDLGLDNAAA